MAAKRWTQFQLKVCQARLDQKQKTPSPGHLHSNITAWALHEFNTLALRFEDAKTFSADAFVATFYSQVHNFDLAIILQRRYTIRICLFVVSACRHIRVLSLLLESYCIANAQHHIHSVIQHKACNFVVVELGDA